jgi:hypothetical protein
MRVIRPYGSEGGAGFNSPFLPLSLRFMGGCIAWTIQLRSVRVLASSQRLAPRQPEWLSNKPPLFNALHLRCDRRRVGQNTRDACAPVYRAFLGSEKNVTGKVRIF